MATAGEGKGDDEEPRTYIARREVKVPCGLEIVVDKIAKYEGCSGKKKKKGGRRRMAGGWGGGRAAGANGRQYCGRALCAGATGYLYQEWAHLWDGPTLRGVADST